MQHESQQNGAMVSFSFKLGNSNLPDCYIKRQGGKLCARLAVQCPTADAATPRNVAVETVMQVLKTMLQHPSVEGAALRAITLIGGDVCSHANLDAIIGRLQKDYPAANIVIQTSVLRIINGNARRTIERLGKGKVSGLEIHVETFTPLSLGDDRQVAELASFLTSWRKEHGFYPILVRECSGVFDDLSLLGRYFSGDVVLFHLPANDQIAARVLQSSGFRALPVQWIGEGRFAA